MDRDELSNILEEHKAWLIDNTQGKRADLSGADLSCANLRDADLSCANLRDADLYGAKTEFCVVNFSAEEYEQSKQFIEGLKERGE